MSGAVNNVSDSTRRSHRHVNCAMLLRMIVSLTTIIASVWIVSYLLGPSHSQRVNLSQNTTLFARNAGLNGVSTYTGSAFSNKEEWVKYIFEPPKPF